MEAWKTEPIEEFARALRALGAEEHDRFLVAVSGGVDSMVLLDMTRRAGLNISAAHVNYGLRGEDSLADADLVTDYCRAHGIAVFVKNISMGGHMRGSGVQTRARKERYAWFESLIQSENLDFVLTAHHADDRLETFFINMLRGGGVRGLKSIPERRGNVLRPLLRFHKSALESYARSRKVPWREDETNRGDNYLRNKVRHHVIPPLTELGARAVENLIKSVDYIGEAHAYFERQADKFIAETPWSEGVGKICDGRWDYLFAHPPLPHYVFAKWGFPADALPEIQKLRTAQSGKKVFGGEGSLYRDRGQTLVSHFSQDGPVEAKLTEPEGRIFRPVLLDWKPVEMPRDLLKTPRDTAYLDADALQWPLTVRRWRRGDRFSPLGMQGSKKISDFLIDAKVPLPEKDAVFVLESNGNVCWVIGHRIDRRYAIGPNTRKVIRFALR